MFQQADVVRKKRLGLVVSVGWEHNGDKSLETRLAGYHCTMF